MSSKWGMFGGSFNDIGTAISAKISTINKNFQSTDDLIGSIKNSGDSTWKRLYPSKESIKSPLIDVDALYPDINDATASKLLTNLQKEQILVNANKKSWQDYFANLSDSEKWQIEFVQNTDLQKASLDDVKGAYNKAREAAIAHNKELENLTLGAKTAALGMKVLTVAANISTMLAFTLAIQAIAEAWDNFNVTVAESQERVDTVTARLAELNREKAAFDARPITSLSDSEKERLQYLNDMIDLERELLDIEQRRTYRNQIGTSFSDYFDSASDSNKLFQYVWNALQEEKSAGVFGRSYQEIADDYESAYEGINRTKEKLSHITDRNSFYGKQLQSDLEGYQEDFQSNESTLRKWVDEYKRRIADLQQRIQENQQVIDAKDRYGNPLMSPAEIEKAEGNIAEYNTILDFYSQRLEKMESALYHLPDNLAIISEKTNLSEEDLQGFTAEEAGNMAAKK